MDETVESKSPDDVAPLPTRTCTICNVCLPDNCWDSHLYGRRHMKKLVRKDKMLLHCTGFPESCTQQFLQNYFREFDSNVQVTIEPDKKVAVLSCTSIKLANDIGRMDRFIDGQQLRIFRFRRNLNIKKARKETPKVKEKKAKTQPNPWLDRCIAELSIKKNLEAQFNFLMTNATLTEEEISVRQALCSRLECMISRIIPCCRIVPFGSFVNGLGMRHGDLDLTLDLGFEINQAIYVNMPARGSTKKLLDKLTAHPNFARAELEHRTENDVLVLLQCLVMKEIPDVQKLYCLHRASVPILGFTVPGAGGSEGIQCDVSVNRRLGAENSRLVKLLQALDGRVRPLLIAILVWAKKKWPKALTARPTSYALVMMVVTFLQSRPQPLLPSIEYLQKLANAQKTLGNWKCHFCDEIDKIPKTANTETKGDLFRRFMNFLLDHDFSTQVMSPLHGCTMSCEEFASCEGAKEFKFSCVNVQDPFEISRNLTKIIQENGAMVMKQTLGMDLELMNNSTWSLYTLLRSDNSHLFKKHKGMQRMEKRKKMEVIDLPAEESKLE